MIDERVDSAATGRVPAARDQPGKVYTTAQTTVRRYDIDWLRVILFGVLIGFHYLFFSPPFMDYFDFWPLQEILDVIHQWRLAALFAISGMGTSFAFRHRSWIEYLLERSVRLLVPLLFATYFLLGLSRITRPLETTRWVLSIFPDNGNTPFGHLWFVYNLFIYSVVLTPLFVYMRNRAQGRIVRCVRALLRVRFGLGIMLVPPLILTLAGILFKPWRPGMVGMWWEFAWYFLFFAFGYLLLTDKHAYFSLLNRIRLPVTIITPLLAVVHVLGREFLALPGWVEGGWVQQGLPAFSAVATAGSLIQAFHAWFWCLFLFSWAAKLLNRPSRGLAYLNQAIYPVYIVHLQLVFVVILVLGLTPIGAVFNAFFAGPLLVALGGLLVFEIVKRARFARVAFGVKTRPPPGGVQPADHTTIVRSILFHGLTIVVILILNMGGRLYWNLTR